MPLERDGRNAAVSWPLSDGALVGALSRSDADAVTELYRRHGAAVRAGARRVLADWSMAEDVVQDVFVNLWSQPARFDPERGTLRTYLLALSRSRAIDALRSEGARRAREQRSERGHGPDVESQVVEAMRYAEVVRAMRSLPERERTAIVLAYLGGRTYREAAVDLGLPEGTVKCRIRTGLRRLQLTLSADDTADDTADDAASA